MLTTTKWYCNVSIDMALGYQRTESNMSGKYELIHYIFWRLGKMR